ncbi:MAG: tetratricopeptide repeat protein [Gammaproteobacteria bacterium]|nr:tetratricopeptide repeat protein [Gammaproteobacteria bacterium]
MTPFGGTLADGGSRYESNSRLDAYYELIEASEYEQAIEKLAVALQDSPQDADLLNLYAFSNRKLARFDVALEHYMKALAVEPEHRGANEYLGELYLQMGELDKAEERLVVLDDACFFGCREYDMLEQAIREYRQQNPS